MNILSFPYSLPITSICFKYISQTFWSRECAHYKYLLLSLLCFLTGRFSSRILQTPFFSSFFRSFTYLSTWSTYGILRHYHEDIGLCQYLEYICKEVWRHVISLRTVRGFEIERRWEDNWEEFQTWLIPNLTMPLYSYAFMNEWMTVYPYSYKLCERTVKELPWSVMLVTKFSRVIPWMYAYV